MISWWRRDRGWQQPRVGRTDRLARGTIHHTDGTAELINLHVSVDGVVQGYDRPLNLGPGERVEIPIDVTAPPRLIGEVSSLHEYLNREGDDT